MRYGRFILLWLLLTAVQVVLNHLMGLSQYILVSLLPAMVLMLPLRMGNIPAMIVAFATGFAVDFFSTGMLGLTSLALVPASLLRLPMAGEEGYSLKGAATMRTLLATTLSCSLFFIIYIWADSAGTVGFWHCVLRFFLSVSTSLLAGTYAAGLLRDG